MTEPAADTIRLICERPQKRSLTLHGHRTSVSLEEAFWKEFRRIARAQDRAINDLAADIDAARGTDCGLASAIRLFVLDALLEDARASGAGS